MKMTRKRYEQIALETGGSHYPEVGGKNLENFADALVRQICAHILATPILSIGAKHLLVQEIKTQYEIEK